MAAAGVTKLPRAAAGGREGLPCTEVLPAPRSPVSGSPSACTLSSHREARVRGIFPPSIAGRPSEVPSFLPCSGLCESHWFSWMCPTLCSGSFARSPRDSRVCGSSSCSLPPRIFSALFGTACSEFTFSCAPISCCCCGCACRFFCPSSSLSPWPWPSCWPSILFSLSCEPRRRRREETRGGGGRREEGRGGEEERGRMEGPGAERGGGPGRRGARGGEGRRAGGH